MAKSILSSSNSSWREYLQMTKPKVVSVMLLTALVGMLLATPELPDLSVVLIALSGIALASAGAAVVNHWVDMQIDQRMARTRNRPLATGVIEPQNALVFAALLSVLGIGLLALKVNLLTAWLTLFALIGYAFIYSVWLKHATPQNITIGGLAGAAPPLLGWTAISGEVTANSLLLVLIIFAWTPPHFWSLCLAREADYRNAKVPMLPVTHGYHFTSVQILLYSFLLVAATALPYTTGMVGLFYLLWVSVLNLRFLHWGLRVYRNMAGSQMAMFRFSISYIMLLFIGLLIDHYMPLNALAGLS